MRLRVRNTGDVVDEYRFEPVGDVAPWTTVEPQSLRLFPGTTGTVALTFAPPRTPDATAGPNPYAVRITPTEHPEATTVPEGNLTITPFTELRAELVPPIVKGRLRGRPRLAVDNLGNTKLTASLNGTDNGDQLTYDIRPSTIQIEPGRAAFIATTLKPRKIIWFGTKEQRPYTLTVSRSGNPPVPVDGTYIQRGFLPRWLATSLGLITALAITFVAFWVGHKPTVSSHAGEKTIAAGAVLTPVPTPTAPLPTPPPVTAQATAPPAPSTQTSSSGGSGGGKATTASKPKPETAATAVKRFAANDPTGRHICYRAFVRGTGWQPPVCDGTMAGDSQSEPITSINISVEGVNGLKINAYVHDPTSTDNKGVWQPQGWTNWHVDGFDLYMGSTEETAPDMSGFGISIGNGEQICSNVRYSGADWGSSPYCQATKSEFAFGGTVDNDKTLEAVEFTLPVPAAQ